MIEFYSFLWHNTRIAKYLQEYFMFKRIFFAVSLPEEIKRELSVIKEDLKNELKKGVKWVEEENMHITLLFLGKVREDRVNEIISEAEKIRINPFSVLLKEITYIPPDKKRAKMIWAKGESKELSFLYGELEDKVAPHQQSKNGKDFIPHITLGRIRSWEFRSMPLSEIPEIGQELEMSFKINSFNLMESKLTKNGPVYENLREFVLQKGSMYQL